MRYVALSLLILANILTTACTNPKQITPTGGNVLLLFARDVTDECEPMADLTTGSLRPRNFQEAQNILRNAAADMGANALLFEVFVPGQEGTGKALRCSPEYVAGYERERTIQDDNQAPINRYEVQAETVLDPSERILWQRCSYGQYADQNQCRGASAPYNWRSALNYCKTLTLQDKRWRLPTVDELRSITERVRNSGILINSTAFPGTRASVYWTSTLYEEKNNVIWVVDFENGQSFGYGNQNMGYVRCVSDDTQTAEEE